MKTLFKRFEGRSKNLFLISGVLIFLFALVSAIYNITNNSVIQKFNFVAPAAIVFAIMGAYGLHSTLIEDFPWPVRITSLLGLLALVGGLIGTIGMASEGVGLVDGGSDWVDGTLAVIPLGYLSLSITGVLVILSNHFSTTEGVLLLLTGILVFSNLALFGIFGNASELITKWVPPVYDIVFALILVGIGLKIPENINQDST